MSAYALSTTIRLFNNYQIPQLVMLSVAKYLAFSSGKDPARRSG
jgi:hypothetical protein